MKHLFVLSALLLGSSCTYVVSDHCPYKKHDQHETVQKKDLVSAKSCSYAPLWLAPMDKDYANVNMIAKKHGIEKIEKIEHTVYPYVLFTKTCMTVHGK
jgi:hypothetical protein